MNQYLKIFAGFFLCCSLIHLNSDAQRVLPGCNIGLSDESSKSTTLVKAPEKRLNFYVISDDKKKFSIMLLRMKIKARWRSLFSKKTMYVVVASNADTAAAQIEKRIKKSGNKKIGNIWFDSHGHYAWGYSSFTIGKDEFNYKSVNDTTRNKPLQRISQFCDKYTQIAIGSCYGGATFTFPGSPHAPSEPMHGDSLMIGIGKIFPASYIYGCESWVMSKPGIFKNRYALAGYPLNKRFKDTGFKPVWERLGDWHRYQNESNTFEDVNSVALNKYGEISLLGTDYQDLDNKKEIIQRKINNLKPGLYKKFSLPPHPAE